MIYGLTCDTQIYEHSEWRWVGEGGGGWIHSQVLLKNKFLPAISRSVSQSLNVTMLLILLFFLRNFLRNIVTSYY